MLVDPADILLEFDSVLSQYFKNKFVSVFKAKDQRSLNHVYNQEETALNRFMVRWKPRKCYSILFHL